MDPKLRALHYRALAIGERVDHFVKILLDDRMPNRVPGKPVPQEIVVAVTGQALLMALLEREDDQLRLAMEAHNR